MKSEANIKLFRPFGPAIAEIDMPDKLVSTLNNYIDDIISIFDSLFGFAATLGAF